MGASRWSYEASLNECLWLSLALMEGAESLHRRLKSGEIFAAEDAAKTINSAATTFAMVCRLHDRDPAIERRQWEMRRLTGEMYGMARRGATR